MKARVKLSASPGLGARSGQQGSARTIILVTVCFVLGAGVSASWFLYGNRSSSTKADQAVAGEHSVALSDQTRAVLGRLDRPVEIRYYSLLDPTTVPDSVSAFAARIDQLVSEYQRAAGGKIKVLRCNTQSYANANAASADGIKAFNSDKGDPCFLGIAVLSNGRKESLPQLSPEWETALEPDLTRAILRATESSAPASGSLAAKTEPATLEEVKQKIPNYASVSVEEGTRMLSESGLKEFKTIIDDFDARVKQAQQRVVEAQKGKSEADQQAALKQLQQLQAEQVEKLKEVANKTQTEIEALQKLKANR